MTKKIAVFLLTLSWGALAAVTGGISVRVDDETAPAGGVAQIRILLTEPKPITTGYFLMDMDVLDVIGVSLFDGAGGTSGVAVVENNRLRVSFSSPRGTFGAVPDYPIMVIAVAVPPNAQTGQKVQLQLDVGTAVWRDLFGQAYVSELKPGVLTVDGTVSIDNVVPGGGTIAAGAPVRITGMGFQPGARVQVEGVEIASAEILSASEAQFTSESAFQLDGRRIRIRNPDGSSDFYYSYHRAAEVGGNRRPLLARSVPMFSTRESSEALLVPILGSREASPDRYSGVAFENLSPSPAAITISAYSPFTAPVGPVTITLEPGMRITRDPVEILPGWGSLNVPGFLGSQIAGWARVSSSVPIRMVNLICTESSGAILPINVVHLR